MIEGSSVKISEPKYFRKFCQLQTKGADDFKLRGNKLLVEKLTVEERVTSGGIVLASDPKHQMNSVFEDEAQISLVMIVGCGIEGEEKTDIEVGNIIITPPNSTHWYSTFPGIDNPVNKQIGLVFAGEVSFVYRDLKAFSKAHGLLNA